MKNNIARLKKLSKQPFVIDILIIFLLSLTPLLWYKHPTDFATGHDLYFSLNPLVTLKDHLYLWSTQLPLGYNYSQFIGLLIISLPEFLLSFLGISVFTTQKITFIFWFFMLGMSAYLLAAVITKNRFLRLFMAVFYTYNHFLLQGWFIAERAKFSMVIALPLVLAVILLVLQKRLSIVAGIIVISFILFFFNGGGILPQYGGLLLGIPLALFFFGLMHIHQYKLAGVKRVFLLAVGMVIGIVMLNAYYIYPLFNYAKHQYTTLLASSGGTSGINNWVEVISKNTSILNIMRLQGIPDWYNNPDHVYANVFLQHPLLIFISFFLPVLAFGAIFIVKDRKEKQYVLFFTLLALLSIIFMAGSHPPFGVIYNFLTNNIPGFAAFRTPFYKFASPLFLSYAFLIGFTLSVCLQYVRRINSKISSVLAVLFILGILAYNYPYFEGNFFLWNKPFTTMVTIPQHIQDFQQWEKNLTEKDGAILYLPELNEEWKSDIYRWNYWSFSPLPSTFSTHPYVLNGRSVDGDERLIVNALYDTLKNNRIDTFYALNTYFGIEYVVVRNDFYADVQDIKTENPQIYKNILVKNNMPRIKSFGPWEVYKLSTRSKKDPSYVYNPLVIDGNGKTFIESIISNDIQNFGFVSQSELTVLPKDIIVANCRDCDKIGESFEFQLPELRILPDSLFYPLVEWSEKRREKQFSQTTEQQVSYQVGLSMKRISEVKHMIQQHKDEDRIIKTLDTYEQTIKRITEILNTYSFTTDQEQKTAMVVNSYLKAENTFLEEILALEGTSQNVRKVIEGIQPKLVSIYERYKDKEYIYPPLNQKRYSFTLDTSGEYDIFIEKNMLPSGTYSATLDNKKLSLSDFITNDITPYALLTTSSLPKGEHTIQLKYEELQSSIIDTNEVVLTNSDCKTFTVQTPIAYDNYAVTFKYLVERGSQPVIMIEQRVDGETEKLIQTKLPKEIFWTPKTIVFANSKKVKTFSIKACAPLLSKEDALVRFSDFSFAPVYIPDIIVKKKNISQISLPIASINTENQTKYIYRVENATDPYLLFLPQRFDGGWNAFIDGNIISKDKHVRANYYGNGWLIDKKGSYNVVVEFSPQKDYIIGGIISGITFISMLGTLIFMRKHGKAH